MNIGRRLGVIFASAMLMTLTIAPGVALATTGNHGLGLNKGCASPTTIGDPYICDYTIFNINPIDSVGDALTFTSLQDVINRPGSPTSGNILSLPGINITFTNGGAGLPSCTGLGTATPSCTLPFGSRVNVLSHSFYTVALGDLALPGAVLSDNAVITWQDLCDQGAQNCPNPGVRQSGSGSSTTVLPSGTSASPPALQHGIGFTKGCESPTHVGGQYLCSYTIQNALDENQDMLTFNSLVDCVFSTATGAPIQPCSEILSQLTLNLSGGASCDGIGGNSGTMSAGGKCTLPFGSHIDTDSFPVYVVSSTDLGGIYDEATLTWRDVCGVPNCPPDDEFTSTGSSTGVLQ